MVAQRIRVEAKCSTITIHEVGNCTAMRHRVGGRDKTQCRNYYFISRFHADSVQGQVQCGSAIDHGNDMFCVRELGEVCFELRNVLANR